MQRPQGKAVSFKTEMVYWRQGNLKYCFILEYNCLLKERKAGNLILSKTQMDYLIQERQLIAVSFEMGLQTGVTNFF